MRTQLVVRRERPGLDQGDCFEQRGGHQLIPNRRCTGHSDACCSRDTPTFSAQSLARPTPSCSSKESSVLRGRNRVVLLEDTQLMPLSRPGAGCARHGFTLLRAKEMSCATLFHSSNMSWHKSGERFSTVWRANSDTTQS